MTYYYGLNGIPIIPNIRCGIDELLPEFLSAIPKNSVIAVGTHGFIKEHREKYEWYCFLERIIDELHPPTIVVYGTLSSEIFDVLKEKSDFVLFEPWITKRRKGELNNVD